MLQHGTDCTVHERPAVLQTQAFVHMVHGLSAYIKGS